MPTIIDSLVVELGLDPSKFKAGQRDAVKELRNLEAAADKHIKPANQRVNQFEQSLGALQGRLLALTGLITGGLGLAAFTQQVTLLTTQTGYLAKSLGVSVEELGKWRGAAASVGAQADEIAGSFQAIQDALSGIQSLGGNALQAFSYVTQQTGQGPAVDLFKDGKKRSPTDILMDMSRWYEAQEDKAQASFLLRNQAGVSPGMVNLLGLGPKELEKRLQQYQQFAPTADQVKRLTELQEAFAKLAATAESLGRTIVTLLSPELIRFMESLEKIITAFKEKGGGEGVKTLERESGKGVGEGVNTTKGAVGGAWDWARNKWRNYIGKTPDEAIGADSIDSMGRPTAAVPGGTPGRAGRNTTPGGVQEPAASTQPQPSPSPGPSGRSAGGKYGDVMKGLMDRGFAKDDAAAVAGNMDAESSMKPGITNSIGAVGLMQWLGPRKKGLMNYAQSIGKSPYDREVQLDWVKLERSGESVKYGGSNERYAFDRALGNGGSVGDKAARFGKFVERPADWELAGSVGRRRNSAQTAFDAAPKPGTSLLRTGVGDRGFGDYLQKTPLGHMGAASAIGRESGTTNTNTSSTQINEMNVSVPQGADPAAYGAGIRQELDRFDNVQNAMTGLR